MTKTCVVTYDDRNLEYKQAFRENHKKYCALHGYEYKAFDHVKYEVPPYWIKVYLVKDLLVSYEIVMWIDSDAMFESVEPIKCERFFKISKDKPQHRIPAPINTGVFIVKNNETGRKFMKKWKEMYNGEKWLKKGKEWICRGKWSGDDYEQGTCQTLLQEEEFAEHTIEEWYVLNNHPYSGYNGQVNHFCGTFGKRMYNKAIRGGILRVQ